MTTWRPSLSVENLQKRAAIIHSIRQFFFERHVLEVDTPVLYSAPASDPHLHSLQCDSHYPGGDYAATHYLQSSPEFAMKRLLAAGAGSIYQLGKAFRDQEQGHQHAIEFSLLEWYRVGWDEHQLMQEVDQLLHMVLKTPPAKYYTYSELFITACGFDPIQSTIADLKHYAQQAGIDASAVPDDKDTWLQFLMTHVIEPQWVNEVAPVMIYDFPASQAALARLKATDPRFACRFEVYVRGIELANGFYELTDAQEQLQRFENDNLKRQQLGISTVPIDYALIDALAHGLPDCAGVALGIDRLIMLALGEGRIEMAMCLFSAIQ